MPPRDARKYLFDIAQEAAQLSEFVSRNRLRTILATGYCSEASSANLKIIGEALIPMSKLDPALLKRVSDLNHGYADVDDDLVRDIVETKLPTLRREIAQIVAESPEYLV